MSSDDIKTIKSSCLCGAASHELALRTSDLPLRGCICHCDSCRHMTGAMCLTIVFLPNTYHPPTSLFQSSTLTPFQFSPRITRYFCTTCGCFMLAKILPDPLNPDTSAVTWDVATGTLETIEGIVDWQGHEYIADTLDGGFSDFLPSVHKKPLDRWPGTLSEAKRLPLHWTSPQRPAINCSPDDKLHAHCKCKGVQFYLTRPSPQSLLAEKYWPEFPPTSISREETEKEEAFYLRSHNTKFLAAHCACNSCRLTSGFELTTWTFVPTLNISLSPDTYAPWLPSFGTMKRYESSKGCYRYFCGRCGAICFYDAKGREWLKDVAVGLLCAQEGTKAESWLGWRTSRVGYRDDAIPRAEGFVLGVEKGLREWEEARGGEDLSGGSQTAGAL